MKKMIKKHFLMVGAIGLFLAALSIPAAASAETAVPHTFSPGTTAKASEVNANFEALADAIDAIERTPGPQGSAGPAGPQGPAGAAGSQGPAGSPDTADQVRGKFFSGASCTNPDNPNDIMVKVGPICVDKYEASVWSNPNGTGTQFGVTAFNFPATFPTNGNWTVPLYAVSKAGVTPSRFVTWFQAQQACALNGKRLLTNAEWQMAAAGTPDPGPGGNGTTTCNTNTAGPLPTGSTGNCVSNWGVHDMVGNLWEWVADWMQGPDGNGVDGAWNPNAITRGIGGDVLAGINEAGSTSGFPAALARGGAWFNSTGAGVFALHAGLDASVFGEATGFRCAR